MKQLYQSPASGTTPVYADSAMSLQIGRLFAGSTCACIGEEDGLAIVLYKVKVDVSGAFKVGFADAAGIRE